MPPGSASIYNLLVVAFLSLLFIAGCSTGTKIASIRNGDEAFARKRFMLAAELYQQLRTAGRLPDFGGVLGVFHGKGSDNRDCVAFFFGSLPGSNAPGAGSKVDADHPVCFDCKKSLTAGEPASFAESDTKLRSDYKLWNGAICFSCLIVFCGNCLGSHPDRCPHCGAKTAPAYSNYLQNLATLLG